jgi:hypothetical protein
MHSKSGAPMRVLLAGLFLLATPMFATPPWEIACNDGRVDLVVEDFDSAWTAVTAGGDIPSPGQAIVGGCHGANALAVTYDLTNVQSSGPNAGQSWVVLVKTIPSTNLASFTHIRLSIKGSNVNSHDTLEVKLKDAANNLHAVALRSMTDLVAWKPIFIDFRELTGGGTLDLTQITGLEIGISRCSFCEVPDIPGTTPPDEHTGTLTLDEFAVVNLKPGGAHRLTQTSFAEVPANATARATAANALLAYVESSGPGQSMTRAWYPEANKNFNTYVQAEALLAFVYEYERSGNLQFRNAANALGARLIELQIAPGKQQAGAWFTGHTIVNNALYAGNRALPEGNPPPCDGDETLVNGEATNLDTCMWAGNTGWALIALGRLQRAGIYPDPAALATSITRGADWIAGQSAYRNMGGSYPNLISLGIEGNLSAYFGLLAAGRKTQAATLGDAIFQFGWDAVQRRIKPGVPPTQVATAIDVSGSWGATFLRSSGRTQEALDSMGYSASIMRTVSFNGLVRGYGDIAGPFTPTVEFTAQAAGAGISDAAFAMSEILSLTDPAYSGAHRGAADHWYGGALSPWATTMAGVSPTAWVHFALHLDPLLPYLPFTNDPIVPLSTPVRAEHVRELRSRISRLRGRFGLAAYPWEDGTVTEHVTKVKARHVQDLRDAVCDVYETIYGRTSPSICSAPTLVPGQAVDDAHIGDVRAAVFAVE